MPNTVYVTGSLYNSAGTKITSGTLYVTPKQFIPNGRDIIVPVTASYAVPGSGNLMLPISPSNGVDYVVQFDPNPADTTKPMQLKAGYFSQVWTIPVNYQWTVANTSGLVGYWTLGESSGTTAYDISPAGHNGTYSGGVTIPQTGAIADGGTAAFFDGVNDVCTIPTNADINFGTASFSVECWMLFPTSPNDPQWSLSKGSPYQAVSAGWGIKCTSNVSNVPVEFHLSDGVVVLPNPPGDVNTSAQPLNLSRQVWHHVVYVVDRPNAKIYGYLDGALVANVTIPGGIGSVSGSGALTLGKGSGNFYKGTLDEVALYNRVLTASEVSSHYALRLFASVDIRLL